MMKRIFYILLLIPTLTFSQIGRHPFYSAGGGGSGNVYTDDFEGRTVDSELGGQGSWVNEYGSGFWVYDASSNRVVRDRSVSQYNQILYYETVTADHYCEVDILGTYSGTGRYMGPVVSAQYGGGGDYYLYTADLTNASRLLRFTNGVVSNYMDTSGSDWDSGDRIRLERKGDSIVCYINDVRDPNIGTAGAMYDVTHTGGYPGIAGKSADNTYYVDNWEGGDL